MIKVAGEMEAIRGLVAASKEAPSILIGALQEQATDVITYIRANWPVDSGRSRAGWTSKKIVDGVQIENDVPYTAYVHNGLAMDLIQKGVAKTTKDVEDRVLTQITSTLV